VLKLGPYEIEVPQGAVDRETSFSIKRPPVNSPLSTFMLVEFGPHNRTFDTPVKVHMDRGISDPKVAPERIRVARWSAGGWVPIESKVADDGRLVFEVDHFSFFSAYCVLAEDPDQDEVACRYPVGDTNPSGTGLYLGWSYTQCVLSSAMWFEDDDQDGVDDFCEEDLAWAFRPEMQFSTDCDWDFSLNRMGGDYYWAFKNNTQRAPFHLYASYRVNPKAS
jgi:hypothetical protein